MAYRSAINAAVRATTAAARPRKVRKLPVAAAVKAATHTTTHATRQVVRSSAPAARPDRNPAQVQRQRAVRQAGAPARAHEQRVMRHLKAQQRKEQAAFRLIRSAGEPLPKSYGPKTAKQVDTAQRIERDNARKIQRVAAREPLPRDYGPKVAKEVKLAGRLTGRGTKDIQTRFPSPPPEPTGYSPKGGKLNSRLSKLGQGIVKRFNETAAAQAGEGMPNKGNGLVKVGPVVLGAASTRSPFASKIGQNAAKDVFDTPTNMAQSVPIIASEALQGHVGKVGEAIVGPAAIKLGQGDLKGAAEEFVNHPVNTTLAFSGLKAIGGRSAGAVLRTAGHVPGKAGEAAKRAGSIKRAPIAAYPGGPKVGRNYSKDSINKALQVYGEHRARKKGRDPNVAKAHGLRRGGLHRSEAEHAVHLAGNETLAMNEAIRRENLANAAHETHTNVEGPRRVPVIKKRIPSGAVRKKTRAYQKAHSSPGHELIHNDAIAFIVDRRLTRPDRVEADLLNMRAKLRAVNLKSLTHDQRFDHDNTVAQVERLLADPKFLAHPEPAFRAAQHYIDDQAPRTARTQAKFPSLNTDAKYMPYAVHQMDARPALHPPDAAGQRKAIMVNTPELNRHLQDIRHEVAAERGVKRAERNVETAKRRELHARGAAEVRVGQADRQLLRSNPEYRAAASDLSKASRELQDARKAHRNAHRNPKMYSNADRAHSVNRLALATREQADARVHFDNVKAKVVKDLQGVHGTRPPATLRRLQARRADIQAAERAVDVAKLAHAQAKAARVKSFVPKGQRIRKPFLVDSHGNEVTAADVRAHMANPHTGGGVVTEPGFFSQRPGATGPTSHYTPSARGGGKRVAMPPAERTALSSLEGTHVANNESLSAQTKHAEGLATSAEGLDFLHNQFMFKRPITDRVGKDTGKRGFWVKGQSAWQAAKEKSAETGIDWVPLDVGRSHAVKEFLDSNPHPDDMEGFSQRVLDSFKVENDSAGQFALIPKIIADKLQQSITPRSDPAKAVQELTRLWKSTVLASSTKWLAGNIGDIAFRGLMSGLHPLLDPFAHKVLRDLGSVDPLAAQQMRARLGMNLYGANKGMDTYRPKNAWQRTPPARVVAGLWNTQQKVVFGLNGVLEREANMTAFGKFARRQIERNFQDMQGFMKTGGPGYWDFIHGLRETHNQVQASRYVESIMGRWGKMSPAAKRVLIHSPFLQWLGVAAKYVFVTLPVHHPIKTGIAANIASMTQQERQKMGLVKDLSSNAGQLVGNQQGGLAVPGGIIPLGKYNSTAIMGDFPEGLPNYMLPGFHNVANAMQGKDAFGKDVLNPDGSKLTGLQILGMTLNSGLESVVPDLTTVRRLREGGKSGRPNSMLWNTKTYDSGDGGVTLDGQAAPSHPSALSKVFNPFLPQKPRFKDPGSDSGDSGGIELKSATAKYPPSVLAQIAPDLQPLGDLRHEGKGATPIVKRRMFAHPQRPANQPKTKPLKATPKPRPKAKPASPRLLHKLADELHKHGYSDKQVALVTKQGKHVKAVGLPAHSEKGIVAAAAKRWHVDPHILWGQYGVETGFGTNVANSGSGPNGGAKGPFQFEDATAKSYGVNVRSFKSSAEGAAHYMHDLIRQHGGDVAAALNAYSGGAAGYATGVAAHGKQFDSAVNAMPFVAAPGFPAFSPSVSTPSSGGGGALAATGATPASSPGGKATGASPKKVKRKAGETAQEARLRVALQLLKGSGINTAQLGRNAFKYDPALAALRSSSKRLDLAPVQKVKAPS